MCEYALPELSIFFFSDLFQSFKSGRLFEQVKQMQRLYENPILLIEFPLGAAFSLQAASEIPSSITGGNIISKLTLLTLHFPYVFLSLCPVHYTPLLDLALSRSLSFPHSLILSLARSLSRSLSLSLALSLSGPTSLSSLALCGA
jgi:ERCC4-type nuclease